MAERFHVHGLVVPTNDKLVEEYGEGPYMVCGIEYKGSGEDKFPSVLQVCVDSGSLKKIPANQLQSY